MRLTKVWVFVLITVFLSFAAPSAHAFDDAILAVVNDEAITVKDLQDYLKGIYAQLRIEGKTPQEMKEIMTEYEAKGIEQLIEDRLILGAADAAGMMLKPKAIDDRLESIKKKYSSNQEFFDALVKEGMTVSEVRKKIENQFKGQFMVDKEVRDKVAVNPQEVTEYFNAHAEEYAAKPRLFLQSIFVKTAYGHDEAKAKIQKAMADVKAGVDFKSVSAQYSELPSVGEIGEEDLRPEIKDKILAVPVGGMTDIIQVSNGFYIFKVEARDVGKNASLKEAKDRIYQKLYEEKFRARFQAWLSDLRKKAYVEIKK